MQDSDAYGGDDPAHSDAATALPSARELQVTVRDRTPPPHAALQVPQSLTSQPYSTQGLVLHSRALGGCVVASQKSLDISARLASTHVMFLTGVNDSPHNKKPHPLLSENEFR